MSLIFSSIRFPLASCEGSGVMILASDLDLPSAVLATLALLSILPPTGEKGLEFVVDFNGRLNSGRFALAMLPSDCDCVVMVIPVVVAVVTVPPYTVAGLSRSPLVTVGYQE